MKCDVDKLCLGATLACCIHGMHLGILVAQHKHSRLARLKNMYVFAYAYLQVYGRFELQAGSKGKKGASQYVRVSKCERCKVQS